MDQLWYVAYGSNLHAARLGWYLTGGRPPGGRRTYPGCRDCRPPRRTVPARIPGGIYFAGESRAWTGGMAFYDPELIRVAAETGRATLGPGRYETLLRVGTRDGVPMLTFTAPGRAADVAWTVPSPVYLGMLARGLREAHGCGTPTGSPAAWRTGRAWWAAGSRTRCASCWSACWKNDRGFGGELSGCNLSRAVVRHRGGGSRRGAACGPRTRPSTWST